MTKPSNHKPRNPARAEIVTLKAQLKTARLASATAVEHLRAVLATFDPREQQSAEVQTTRRLARRFAGECEARGAEDAAESVEEVRP